MLEFNSHLTKKKSKQLDDFKRLKDEFPDRCLIASIMEEYDKDNWLELVERVEGAGVDAIEINFSCPHGMPGERVFSSFHFFFERFLTKMIRCSHSFFLSPPPLLHEI